MLLLDFGVWTYLQTLEGKTQKPKKARNLEEPSKVKSQNGKKLRLARPEQG